MKQVLPALQKSITDMVSCWCCLYRQHTRCCTAKLCVFAQGLQLQS
jgi:hypothetical protein